jgi:hypothetical protein
MPIRPSVNSLSVFSTLDFPSIGAGLTADLTTTVTGALALDPVVIGCPSTILSGITFFGWVSSSNTVTVRAVNNTAGIVDPSSALYRIVVLKV